MIGRERGKQREEEGKEAELCCESVREREKQR